MDIAGALTTGKRQYRPALALNHISELLERLDTYRGHPLTRLATKRTLLIFIRSSVIRFARLYEIDFRKSMWTIPPKRKPFDGVKHYHRGSKIHTEHLVPVSTQALGILQQFHTINGEKGLIF